MVLLNKVEHLPSNFTVTLNSFIYLFCIFTPNFYILLYVAIKGTARVRYFVSYFITFNTLKYEIIYFFSS